MKNVDWHSLFVPEVSVVELILRGTMMYLALFALMRILGRRQMGSFNLMDLLVLVLIADAAQNAMASDYKSVPEGIVLCATLVAWNYLLDWLAFRSPALRRWLEPAPLPLVQNGRILRRNLRDQMITEEELMSHLREQGVENAIDVKSAFIEPDGVISVIKKDAKSGDSQTPPRKPLR